MFASQKAAGTSTPSINNLKRYVSVVAMIALPVKIRGLCRIVTNKKKGFNRLTASVKGRTVDV